MARAKYLAEQAARTAKTAQERAAVCQHCSKLFHTTKIGQRYCSTDCVAAARTEYDKQHTCEKCGKPFRPTTNGAQGAATRFCSRSCADEARTKPVTERVCEYAGCGKSFMPKRERTDRPIRFCSKSCAAKAQQARARSGRPVLTAATP
jgi:hypothetical protein